MTITDDDLSRWEALAVAVPEEERQHGWPESHVISDEAVDLLSAARDAVPALCAEVLRLRSLRECDTNEKACIYEMHSQAVAARDALRLDATVEVQQVNLAELDALRAEASELRARLADAVGKIEVMRTENEQLRGRLAYDDEHDEHMRQVALGIREGSIDDIGPRGALACAVLSLQFHRDAAIAKVKRLRATLREECRKIEEMRAERHETLMANLDDVEST